MSEERKVKGVIKKIYPINQVSDTFKKRDFVIVTEEKYPQELKLELSQNAVSLIDDYSEGQEVTAHFNLKGRCWINKNNEEVYFVSLNAWRMEREGNNTSTQEQKPVETAHGADDNESLPF